MLSMTSSDDTLRWPLDKAQQPAGNATRVELDEPNRALVAHRITARAGRQLHVQRRVVIQRFASRRDCAMTDRPAIRGFTMLEVLIAIVVIAFGLLGIAGLQAFAMKNNHSASLRITATTLSNDMVDRMKANYMGVDQGDYNKPSASDYNTAVPSCLTTAGCTFQELAQNDLNEWSQHLANALPNGRGIVCVDSTPNDGVSEAAPACDGLGTTLFAVKIWWIDDRTATGSAAAPQRFSWAFNP